MAEVLLSLGSNIDRQYYIGCGLDALSQSYGELRISSVYESEAVGFVGERFYNLVVGLQTDQSLSELFAHLRQIELAHDRSSDAVKFSPRTLDIDILTYDDFIGAFQLDDGCGGCLPRAEITRNAFVLWPLAELVPDRLLPGSDLSYQTLWQAYDQASQSLWPVAFTWQGRQLSAL